MLSAGTLTALGSILAIFKPVIAAFFDSFGRSLNDFFDRKRAEQNAKDLGAAEARIEQQGTTIDAQQAELQAQADAPKSADDAIKRLEEGSA
jgi:hypothetical protein